MLFTSNKKLYKEFEELLKADNEKDLEAFLGEKFDKLSEKYQDKVTLSLLKKTLDKANSDQEKESSLEKFQAEGIKTLKKLENLKKQVEDKKKELELKESLN